MKTVNEIIANRLRANSSEKVAELFLAASEGEGLPQTIAKLWQLEIRDNTDIETDSISRNSASTDIILGLQDARFSSRTTEQEKAFCKLLFNSFNSLKKSQNVRELLRMNELGEINLISEQDKNAD